MQNPSTLLLSLPEDQLSILLSYLALNDVVRLRATCKYLRDAIIPFPEDQLTTIISYLTLNDVLRLRATCDYFRGVTSTATNHLWMDRGEEAERLSRYHTCLHNPYRIGNSRIRPISITTTRMQCLHAMFPSLHTIRIIGLNIGTRGILGEVVNEDANLECLELLDAVECSSFPSSCNMHHDMLLRKLKKLSSQGH